VLTEDIQDALKVLPQSIHDLLLDSIVIWINYHYTDRLSGRTLTHSTTHHCKEWLRRINENEEKAPGIEIYDARQYMRSRCYFNGYGLILHEYCHVIHQFVLGLHHTGIKELHQKSLRKLQYQCVFRRDWLFGDRHEAPKTANVKSVGPCSIEVNAIDERAPLNIRLQDCHDISYALVNEREYFAEMSVALLCCGYKNLECIPLETSGLSLDDIKKRMSPPLVPYNFEQLHCKFESSVLLYLFQVLNWIRIRWNRFLLRCGVPTCSEVHLERQSQHWHCNKFYPFTRDQLEDFDPDACLYLQLLWREIAEWKQEEMTNLYDDTVQF